MQENEQKNFFSNLVQYLLDKKMYILDINKDDLTNIFILINK